MTPLRLRAPKRVPCPACAEPVLADARKCRYCGEWFADVWAWSKAQGAGTPATIEDLGDAPFERGASRRPPVEHDQADGEDIAPAALRVDAISLEVGAGLAQHADPDVDGELLVRLRDVRERIAHEFGVVIPRVRVRPLDTLQDGQYQIRIKGDIVAHGEVVLGSVLGMGADLQDLPFRAEHTTDPVYGTPAVWLTKANSELAEEHGLQVFDAQDLVATHTAEVIKHHLAEVLTREEVAELLNLARKDSPMVVQELVPNMLSLGQLRQVLQNLVRERLPINDLATILNALADNAVYTKDPYALTEHARQSLGRRICTYHQSPDGLIRAFMLSPDAERAVQNAIQLNETGQVLMLDPTTSQAIQNNLADALSKHRGEILDPIIVTPTKIRRHVKSLLERHFSKIVVLSYSEIVPGVQIENLEMIEASTPGQVPRAGGPGGIARSDWLSADDSVSTDDAENWQW